MFQYGILSLYNGKIEQGLEAFDAALEHAEGHVRHLSLYYKASALAHSGDKSAAGEVFSELLKSEGLDSKLEKAATRALKKTKSWRAFPLKKKQLKLMMQVTDVTEY